MVSVGLKVVCDECRMGKLWLMIISVFATLDGLGQLIKHNTTKFDEALSARAECV